MKKTSKEFRNMGNLSNITSTSRVLNLNLLTQRLLKTEGEHETFFRNKSLNNTLILKSIVQPPDKIAFSITQDNATKLFKPFDRNDLAQGGLFAFIGQPNLMKALQEYFGFQPEDNENNDRDMAILKELDRIPSLDPFLLREKMSELGVTVDKSYFQIDEMEWSRIKERIISDFVPLAQMAFGEKGKNDAARSLADKIWDPKQTQLLKPILKTLDIPQEKASEIIFSWKGLLYYKYQAQDSHADLVKMLKEIESARIYGYSSIEQKGETQKTIRAIRASFTEDWKLCHKHLASYEKNYIEEFVGKQNPQALKQTLTNASEIFDVLGTVIGSTKHCVSYWRYFSGSRIGGRIAADDFDALLDDFRKGTGLTTMARAPTERAISMDDDPKVVKA